MADIDDTQEQEKKGGGLSGAAAGIGAGYLAGAGAAQIAAKPDKIKESLGNAETTKKDAVKAFENKVEELKTEHANAYSAAAGAETLQKGAEKSYNDVVSDKWNEAIKAEGVKPEAVKEVRAAGLNAQKEVLSKLPKNEISDEARALATKGVDAQIADLKLAETKDVEASLAGSWNKAMETAKKEAVDAAEKKEAGTGVKAAAEFDSLSSHVSTRMETEIAKTEPVNKAFANAAKKSGDEGLKKAEATIIAHPDVTKAEEILKAPKTPEAEAAKGAWNKIVEDATKKDLKPAQDKAIKEVENLTARAEAAESGFFKKPLKLAMKGSKGEKAAVIVTSLLAASAAYLGVKAYKNRNRSDSYADQITQERATAAAPTPDQGAARA